MKIDKIKISAIRLLLFSIILILLASGCVYYNTFYHAKKKFNQAWKAQQQNPDHKASESNKRVYDEAIKKASKVLTFHPESKYVDDALYLIGKAYYNTEEWRKASRKFRELIANFPESKFADESTYLLGMCSFKLENYNQAEEPYRDLLARSGKTDYSDDAAFMLGEIRFAREEYNDAIEYYRDMLEQFPKSDLKARTLSRMGDCALENKQYSEATEQYRLALKSGPDTDLRYDIKFTSGECRYKLGEYNEGLKIFNDLKSEKKYYDKIADIKLKIAEGYSKLDQTEEALKIYEDIPVESSNTPEAARAYYEIGQIYQQQGELDKAKEAYLKVKEHDRQSEYSQMALSRSSEISKLESYRTAISGDSTRSDIVQTQLLLAESMLFEFSQPDSALKEYLLILKNYPYSKEAPLAYYALGYIYRNIKADTAQSDSFYIELAGRYPDTPYGISAAEYLGILEVLPDSLNAEKMFAFAEEKLFDRNDPDSAILIYQEIEADHPGTDDAARAAYAVSYIIDNYIFPEDSTAVYSYQLVVEKYPETEYADAAKLRLGLTSRQVGRQRIGQMVEGDTSMTFDPEDTTTYSQAGMELAPEPDNKAELRWPASLRKKELRGMVVVRFFLGIFGDIAEVELLTESGNTELDQAIIRAMSESSYEAQDLKTEQLNRYYIYRYEFVSPESAKKTGEGL